MNILIKLMSIVSLVIAPYLSINGIVNVGGLNNAASCAAMQEETCVQNGTLQC